MSPPCQVIGIIFQKDELKAANQNTTVGEAFDNVPFYDGSNGDLIGFYSDQYTSLPSGDCVGSGTFSFGPGSDPFPTQITISFSCFGDMNAIVGGNGDFGCAKGFEQYVYEDDVQINSELNICSQLCPFSASSA